MSNRQASNKGFTIVELLVVIVVIGILAALTFTFFNGAKSKAYYNRALSEFRVMRVALERYQIDNGSYPPDANRDVPPGIEQYIQGSDANKVWPNAPWPDSVYDWDVFDNNGVTTYQISIRFCPIGNSAGCKFPKEDWAENFQVNSSFYYCMEGNCKAHPSKAQDYPGYCVNCGE